MQKKGKGQSVVGIVMGSDSDWPLLEPAASTLREFGVPCEKRILSAHRAPAKASQYAKSAAQRGIKIIIAAAGGAAHLAGLLAAHSILPVIGVPVRGGALTGMDALLSTVQMPAGVPVATVAVGSAGPVNAALLAVQILALQNQVLAQKLHQHKHNLLNKVTRADQKIQSLPEKKIMSKIIAILIGLQIIFLGSASTRLFAAADQSAQSAVVSRIMRDVTELGDILQKKHAIFEPSAISTNITAAIIKAIDPYGEVQTKEQAERRGEELHGVFYGVGIKITIKDKLPVIMDVVKGGPAEAEGLKTGDIIEKIGDQKTKGMSLEEAVSRLRGAKDETVLITIRANEKKQETRECKLKRTLIQMPVTGVTEEWPHQIYYLKINGLYENSGIQIVTQLVAWAETKGAGIILDLRNANGGDLQSAADTAGLFQPSGTASINIRDGSGAVITSYQGKAGKTIDAPLMVLINRDTSGAAEALAAALGIGKGVLLIGTPTRGDDCVREFIPLADGCVIYLATRRIEIKNSASYHGAGVNPHVSVAQTNEPVKTGEIAGEEENGPFTKLSEEEKLNRALIRRTSNDAILQRAADILLGLKALNIKGR